jgi:hypothetical protein
MAKAASADFRNQLDEEFVEVVGKGGNFAPMHDFDENDTLVGTYLGTEVKDIKGEDRVIHHFEVDGEPVDVWGAAILDSRLETVREEGPIPVRLKVVYRGKTTTSSGRRAKDFAVFVSKRARREVGA